MKIYRNKKRKIVNLQSNINFIFYVVYTILVEIIYTWINVEVCLLYPSRIM